MHDPSAIGAGLYKQHCAHCHNGSVAKAPHLVWLSMIGPQKIYKALNSGIMRPQAAALNDEQHRAIAEYLTNDTLDNSEQLAYAPACDATRIALNPDARLPKTGWGHDTSRFIPAEIAKLSATDVPKLELKWAYAFPGVTRARSQPAVGFGAVYMGSEEGSVYALDVETGCAHWRFEASAEVRTGVVLSPATADQPPIAVFGDVIANLYAVNALTGELMWRLRADEHPSATLTGTPAVSGNTVYAPVSSLEVVAAANPEYDCCRFRGNVLAVDLASGDIRWRHYSIPEPPALVKKTVVGTKVLGPSGAPIWGSPTVDEKRGLLYVGTGENYSSPADGNSDAIIAVTLDGGQRAWEFQSIKNDAWNTACQFKDNPNCPVEKGPDYDYGASILLVDLPNGKQVLVAGNKNGAVSAHDPDNNGALLWREKVGRGSIQGGVHFGMAAEGSTVYVPINDMNHSNDGSILDESAARPGVNALNAANGERLWSHVQKGSCPEALEFCDLGVSSAVTAIPGVLFAGHLDGFLRAYNKKDGRVLWEYDTKQAVPAVNGVMAKGGSMSGPGATIANGHVFLNSGYGFSAHMPGNMFAVFGVSKDD
ncbi:MAG: PQQ-binding-like beta-propeller repeat protein [Pseudomonadales bacterium]